MWLQKHCYILAPLESLNDAPCLKPACLPSAGQTQLPSLGRWITPAVLLYHGLLTHPSLSKGKGCTAEPKHWSKDERISQHFCFILLRSLSVCFSLARSVLLGSVFLSVSLGRKRRKNNKQPEEIFPVVLHTLQCTRIVKWSLGTKTGGEK